VSLGAGKLKVLIVLAPCILENTTLIGPAKLVPKLYQRCPLAALTKHGGFVLGIPLS
jgi:hypothetical protein